MSRRERLTVELRNWRYSASFLLFMEGLPCLTKIVDWRCRKEADRILKMLGGKA